MPSVPFALVVLASTLLDALVASAFLVRARLRADRRGENELTLRSILLAAAWTGVIVLAKQLLLREAGVRDFGVIHLVYIDLTVLIPLTGLALLVLSRRPVKPRLCWALSRSARLAAVASLGMIPVGVYASWVEPFRLQVESVRAKVSLRRQGKEPVRIGVLSDLQTNRVTDYERKAVERLLAQKPDIIVLPGDVFQGTPEEFEATRYDLKDLLERLTAPGGVFLVLGDTDGNGAHLDEILRSSEIRVLRDEVIRTSVRDRRITIGGVSLKVTSENALAVVERLEATEGEDDVRVVVAHRPDVVLGLRPLSRIDLVIAGHTHGGQIVVPGYGPPLTLTRVPRAVAAGGLHRLDGNLVYVSRGVGCERGYAPRIRFLCPPEISLIELGDRPSS